MLEIFRCMVNDSIKIGLETDSSSMKRLSTLSYRQLKKYRCYSAYRLTAISKAAGILASRKNRSDEAARQRHHSCPMRFSFPVTDSK